MLILADSNIWLALTLSKHTFHSAARRWFDGLKGDDVAVFCRSTQQSYLRLLTTAEVLAPYGVLPLSNAKAWATYEGWIATGRVSFMGEPGEVDSCWKGLAVRETCSPKLWMDAYLAAFATAGGYRLVTTDRGFRQFKGLDLEVVGRP